MRRGADFYAALPVFAGFGGVLDSLNYQPLPDDWHIGTADVVDSTRAIEDGRYKAVNTAGASAIAAMMNALDRREFPFVFSGDGASFAIAPVDEVPARRALAATAAWARDELGLALRVALVPVSAIRVQGLDVRVARFAASSNVSYAMFSGGGLAWAEAAMKRGLFAVTPGPQGSRPDLSGLSCRWQEMPASRGVILSLLLVPTGSGDHPAFRTVVEELLATLEGSQEVVRPLPERGPALRWPSAGLELEARVSRKSRGSLLVRQAKLLAEMFVAFLVFRCGIRIGRFDPRIYRHDLVENSDFRKYDDGLRMTLDCTPEFADQIETRLEQAKTEGFGRFGLHRQTAAIMTCITPSIYESNHVHFIDGAAGGYASAARRLKRGPDTLV